MVVRGFVLVINGVLVWMVDLVRELLCVYCVVYCFYCLVFLDSSISKMVFEK